MQQYKQPTKEQIREWIKEMVASHQPPPEPEVIRHQLWSVEERDRKMVLS